MSTPPPADIATALRTALPPQLHHLITPLTHTLEALADPVTGAAVSQAIAQLRGQEVRLTSGSLVSFAESNIGGDVTMRDVAGRDVINFAIHIASSGAAAPEGQNGTPDAQQLQILKTLAVWGPKGKRVSFFSFSRATRIPEYVVRDEFVRLMTEGWIFFFQEHELGGVVGVTPQARKLLSSLSYKPEALSDDATKRLHRLERQFLLHLFGGFADKPVNLKDVWITSGYVEWTARNLAKKGLIEVQNSYGRPANLIEYITFHLYPTMLKLLTVRLLPAGEELARQIYLSEPSVDDVGGWFW